MTTIPPPSAPEPTAAGGAAAAARGASNGGPDPEARVRALTRMVDRALHRIQQLETRITGLSDTITAAAPAEPTVAPAGGAGGGQREGPLPTGVRSWLLADDPAQADADLTELGVWVWRVYLWWPDAWLSSCWLWHPEVIEELWWLRVAHAEAYHPETGSSLRVADWHERHRPGVARRAHHILGRCELSRHVPFNGRPVEVTPPGPPALARHAPDVAAVWTAGAGLDGIDVVRATGPEPTPDQLAEADAYQRALYGRHR